MAKDNDRQRLREIEQTDITESRLNEDLVHWLKTSGPTYLLVILVAITAYLGFIRWQQYKSSVVNQAWIDLASTDRPESLEELADTHANVYAVPLLALERAADMYLTATVTGKDFASDAALAPALNDEQRADYLAKADRLYEAIVTRATSKNDDEHDTVLHAVYGLFGRAAVAEAKGELDAARGFYNDAAAKAGDEFPALAAQAKGRAANVDDATKPVFLPSVNNLPVATSAPARTPVDIDSALEPLIFPESMVDPFSNDSGTTGGNP